MEIEQDNKMGICPDRLCGPPEHLDRNADLETELQVQRRVRGALDAPFVLGPPRP